MEDSSSPGLLLESTATIRDFLSSCTVALPSSPSPSPSSSSTVTSLSPPSSSSSRQHTKTLPYKLVRDAWFNAPASSRPPFRELVAGSTLVYLSPAPREKSEELKARLARLQDLADRKAYNDLVKDVTPEQRETEYFSSYRDQLGFGLHVVVVMFTGYLCGHALFRSQFGGHPVLHAAGGIFGMVLGMLVETLLFIIRASKFEDRKPKSKKYSSTSGTFSRKVE